MRAIGKIEIEEGLCLNNPTMEIVNISYPQLTNDVIVEIHFCEENSEFKHSRTFVFKNIGGADLVYNDVLTMVKSREILCLFK